MYRRKIPASHQACPHAATQTIGLVMVLLLLAGVVVTESRGATKKRYTLLEYTPTGLNHHWVGIFPEDRPLCEAYEKNLNAFAYLPHPMACERLLHPTFPEFSTPPWQTLDPKEHVDLIKQMDLQLNYRWKPETFQEPQWREHLTQRLAKNYITLRLARVDIRAKAAAPSTTRLPTGFRKICWSMTTGRMSAVTQRQSAGCVFQAELATLWPTTI